MTIGSGIAVLGIWATVAFATWVNPVAGVFISIFALAATSAIVSSK